MKHSLSPSITHMYPQPTYHILPRQNSLCTNKSYPKRYQILSFASPSLLPIQHHLNPSDPLRKLIQSLYFILSTVSAMLLYPHAYASHHNLSYQQIATANLNGGYQSKHQFFIQQQGLLSHGPRQFHYQIQCQPDQCTWQTAKLNLKPTSFSLEIGYDKRFQSHILARSQPFFGIIASTPNLQAHPIPSSQQWQPWLGITMPKAGLMQLRDPTGTIQQTTLGSGSHILPANTLPTGAYPIALETTDQTGTTHSVSQFVNNINIHQPITQPITFFTVGLPTNQAVSSNYGLPPISPNLNQLLVNLSHRFPSPIGTTQTSLNLQKQQLSAGLNNRFQIAHSLWQPELLWMRAQPNNTHQQNLAIGLNAQNTPNPSRQWKLLATTYPTTTNNTTLPWIIHSQIQWLKPTWLASITCHITENHKKNYLQGLLRKQLLSSKFSPVAALSARLFDHGIPALSLTFSTKEKNRHAWRAKITNQQQTLQTTLYKKPPARVKINIQNQSDTPFPQQRITLGAHWQDHLAKWHATTTIPLQSNHSTWSIQAKTGLACVGHCLIWTPLHSIQSPGIIQFSPNSPRHFFYWGSLQQLQQTGLNLQKKHPYATPPHSKNILYPSNLIISQD